MANTYLQRTPSSAGNRKTCTFSAWVKRGNIGNNTIIGCYSANNDNDTITLTLRNNGQLRVSAYNVNWRILNRLFRDTNAWYHIVLTIDTTQSTANDRIKVYVNGVQETSFSTINNPSQNADIGLNQAATTRIGAEANVVQNHFDGSMTHVYFIDGTAYTPSAFGETDATTGEWKAKTSPSVNYGTNGFLILKDGNTITDQSSNSNNFTLGGGTLTDLKDNPENVFATMATPTWYDGTIANGGNTVSTDASAYRYQTSSLGVNSGKWYWEVKLTTANNYALMGITDAPSPINVTNTWILGSGAYDYSVVYNNAGGNGHKYNNAGTNPTNTPGAFMGGFAQGDIIMFALDLDSATKKLYIGTNDLWSNGSGSTNQTFANSSGISITIPENTNGGFYFPAVGDYGGGTSVVDFNFGNGYFGTTSVSSAGTNASDNGIFEYDVPTGYTALSTKGLNL